LAAWDIACKPKDQGGLGIIDIQKQNDALLLTFLDKFYNCADVLGSLLSKFYSNIQTPPHARSPVGSFWWKDIMRLCYPNKGNSVLFWSDIWVEQSMKDKYPQLFSFARKPKCSVRFYLNQTLDRIFSLPLSQLAAA